MPTGWDGGGSWLSDGPRHWPCTGTGASWVPLTQRNGRGFPTGGRDRGLRGGVEAGSASPPGTPQGREAECRGRAPGALRRGGLHSSQGFSRLGRASSSRPSLFLFLAPIARRLLSSPGLREGRGAPAFGGARAAGCAGTRRRPPLSVPPALPRRLPGADSPGFSALLTSSWRRAPSPRGLGLRGEPVLSPRPPRGQ